MAINTGKNGLVPKADLQIAVTMAQADTAYRIARSQAARGVPQQLAAEHGSRAATALFYYWLFVFPVVMFTALVIWVPNPFIMLWKSFQVMLGVVILVRMHKWVHEPATNVISYKIPTWVLVVTGGVSAIMFCFFGLILIAIS
jgi:hypothetical protein